MKRWIARACLVLFLGAYAYLVGSCLLACTIDVEVPQPVVNIGCAVLNSPYERLESCDGGQVPLSPPHDAGTDHGG